MEAGARTILDSCAASCPTREAVGLALQSSTATFPAAAVTEGEVTVESDHLPTHLLDGTWPRDRGSPPRLRLPCPRPEPQGPTPTQSSCERRGVPDRPARVAVAR